MGRVSVHVPYKPVCLVMKRKLRVLSAEDNRVNQRLLLGLLTREGHLVTMVEDGEAAVAASGEQKFNAILMDIQMPRLDGLEATRRIRMREQGTGEHIPIIALTAFAVDGDREKCLQAGMDFFIAKPLHKHDLLGALERFSLSEDLVEEFHPADESETAHPPAANNNTDFPDLCGELPETDSAPLDRVSGLVPRSSPLLA
jgi:CheY-like chemotaxis protein